MKQGSFRALSFAVCLILMAGITVSTAFGDDLTHDFVSITLDDFSSGGVREWTIGSRSYRYEFSWAVDGSRFASVVDGEVFPKLAFADTYPLALYGQNREGRNIQSLGIWGKFDRRGYNWIDLYPINEDGDPFEIPIPGRVSHFDSWMWGSNHNFYVEVYLRDYQGVVHNIYLGSLAFQGWKNLRVRIPTNIPQSRRTLPTHAGLTFVKFRFWTTPLERVDNFFIYIDHFKVLTDIFEGFFDGDELADPVRVQDIWSSR